MTGRRTRIALVALAIIAIPAGEALAQYEDYITLPNGQRVRATDPEGGRAKVNPDGSVTYPDGTAVSVSANDMTEVRRSDGGVNRSAPPDTFTLPNGQEVRATDPSGRRGKQNADGSVTYPDGTRIGMDSKGNTEVAMGDGSRRTVDAPPKGPADPRAPSSSPTGGTITLPDGTQVPAHGRDGQPGTIMPDGSVGYTDGSTIRVGPDGQWMVEFADGTIVPYRDLQDAIDPGGRGAGNPFDVNDGNAASERMLERVKKIADLEMQRDNCAKGAEGRPCRDALRDAIRQLEQENKAEAQRYLDMVRRGQPR